MAFVAAIMFAACSPQEFDDYNLGSLYTIGDDQFTFEMTPGSNQWTYNYKVTISVDPVKYPYTYEVRFGDGKIVKDLEGTHKYVVLKGTYIAQCMIFTPNGEITIKEKTITINEDNPEVYQDDLKSPQFALTGGKDNLTGKEWVLITGSGLGPIDGTWGEWWGLNDEPALFNDIFTFKPNSIQPNGKFVYDNNGDTFMNETLGSLFPDGDPAGSFITTHYTPSGDASWEIVVRDGVNWLIVNKGFMGYAISPNDLTKSEYEIMEFSPTEIKLKYYAADGNAWFFILSSEEPEEVVFLTGGRNAENGKGWKLRPNSGIIMTSKAGEVWWTVDNSAVGSEAAYDDILTFVSDGKAILNNNGNSYMNETTGGLFSDGKTDGSFVTTKYVPSDNASWKFTTVEDKTSLVLTDVFPMYALSPELMLEGSYELVEITEELLHIIYTGGEDVNWNYYLVPTE